MHLISRSMVSQLIYILCHREAWNLCKLSITHAQAKLAHTLDMCKFQVGVEHIHYIIRC